MGILLEVNPLIIIFCLVTFIGFLYRYMKDTYSVLERLGIPGPKPIWVFGNVLEFKGKNVLKVFDDWKQKYGKVYGFYEGFRAGIVINDVDYAQDILNRYFDKFSLRTSYRPFVYYPDNLRLIEIDGDHWKNQRIVFNKMLNSPTTIKLVIAKMQITAKEMLQQISDELKTVSDGINISSAIDHYVSEGIIRIALNPDDDKLAKYKQPVYEYEIQSNWSASADNETGGLARIFPWLVPFLRVADKKYKDEHDNIVAILRQYTDETSPQNNNQDTREVHDSLFAVLSSSKVPCRDVEGRLAQRTLATDEIIAHMLTLLSEVHPTTTALIQFILYELACHQDCQDKLYDEIQNMSSQYEEPSYEELQNMEYLDMIINETYRHHPVAPGVSRVCSESCTIRDVRFEKGMVVRVMTCSMYKDEKLFNQPEDFIPERFSTENRRNCHQYSFLPFGQGPRICPGQKLALIKVKIAIISIVKNYKLTTCKNTEIPLQQALRPSLTPANGVCIQLSRRGS
ncbi:cytochrome P450 3A4-like [Ruditapes philippinarum]|uniref:cytochrome P450 3A4-like n=1 Tax=Ruditapes philippinarum TaxID=129788 RepID=UPI00295BA467|nr:cytochrome P450 3A4-like [Ruditapes philippinarum]XP_060576970.1 cytochrome P450 3A4-like [Ruditapes philippinarum]